MYNGIGLRTVRGSGTSGHVQANISLSKAKNQIRRMEEQRAKAALKDVSGPGEVTIKKANPDILQHEAKRKIELQLCLLQDELEEAGADEDEVERRVQELRDRLTAADAYVPDIPSSKKATDSHVLAAAKAKEDEKMRRAFGISEGHVMGQAFDRELQDKRREDARIARETKALAVEKDRRSKEDIKEEAERGSRRRDRKEDKADKDSKHARRGRSRSSGSSASTSISASSRSRSRSSYASSSSSSRPRRKDSNRRRRRSASRSSSSRSYSSPSSASSYSRSRSPSPSRSKHRRRSYSRSSTGSSSASEEKAHKSSASRKEYSGVKRARESSSRSPAPQRRRGPSSE